MTTDARTDSVTAELNTDTGRITIGCRYADKDLVRLIPGRKWDGQLWSVACSWAACQALRGVFGDRLQIGANLAAWATAERANRIDPSLALRDALDYPGDERLYRFQRAGVQWLQTAQNCLLADDMGSGKGVQAAFALGQAVDATPAIVISPKSVMETWRRELEKWSPHLSVSVVTGPAGKRSKALAPGSDVYIISWDNLRRHSRLAPYGSLRLKHCQECDPEETGKHSTCERCARELNELGFKTVIADEAHYMKDPSSKRTRACWAIQHGKTVTRRWSLTGTPVANHPGDLWALMHGVAPDDFPGRTQFLDRYALLSWNMFGGLDIVGISPQTRDEFFRIVDPRFRRMPKSLVLPDLPPKLFQERLLDMPPTQKRAYLQMAEHLVAEVANGRIMATNPLAQLTRLMQFASATCNLREDGTVEMIEPSCKIDELVEIMEELGDQPFLVSAESRLLIDLTSARLAKLHVPHSLIVGGQSEQIRQQSIDDFQNGRVRACMFTLKAGGVGLTLTRAGYMIRMQRSYNAIDNRQGEDRFHRIGSEIHENVFIIDLVAEGTIEETSQKLQLFEKSERAEEVLRDRDSLLRLLKS